ncbi:hypothetical protein ACFSPU_09245 [Haoranjiania flava]|uniref:Uncharacterized protein n=1 Tax=Haoranjiania flava TaxID=1856322 RepID=A0AAE3LM04_9BACT|nr:hypothetical protein [Haoranjiania flava]MCU7693281.1 hypothetical protein [Haoranjiania flava]
MNITKNTSHQEGEMTKAIENQTAKLPSTVYLGLALASMAISLGLKVAKQNNRALFVGQWAAPFLIMGIYNKIVKVEGND